MCTIRDLYAFEAPADWRAAPLFTTSCEAFLASFKVWNSATVGGNICMSLPAGPMITMTVALEATYTLRATDGSERTVDAVDFVTGNHENVLAPGELLRKIDIPAERAAQAPRPPAIQPDAPGPVDDLHDRDSGRTRRLPADDHRGHDPADPAVVRLGARRRRPCRTASTRSRTTCGSTTRTARPTTASTWRQHFAEEIRGDGSWHDVHRQRRDLQRGAATGAVPAHIRPLPGLARRQEGLRRRRLRRMHSLARRRPGAQLHHARVPRRRSRGHHDRGARHTREPAPAAATVPRRPRLPVRVLHRGHDHDLGDVHRRAEAGPAARAEGKPLPLHGIPRDRGCGQRRRRTSRRRRPGEAVGTSVGAPGGDRRGHRSRRVHDGHRRWTACCT